MTFNTFASLPIRHLQTLFNPVIVVLFHMLLKPDILVVLSPVLVNYVATKLSHVNGSRDAIPSLLTVTGKHLVIRHEM